MYKVDYFTLAKCDDGTVGNIKQYSDTWYTDHEIEAIPAELQRVIDIRKGSDTYVPVIVNIGSVKGHLDR